MDEQWTTTGEIVTAASTLAHLRAIMDHESPIVVEHRFYRGAQAPHRFVCESGDELEEYIRGRARPGDSFYFWSFEACCREDNRVARGKVPDSDGRIPIGGVY